MLLRSLTPGPSPASGRGTKRARLPGILAYVATAMWLLQLAISPADAAGSVASRVFDHLDEISAALIEKGAPANAKIALAEPGAIVAVEADEALSFDSVSYNRATGRFLMRTIASEGSPAIAVAGIATASVMLPVPARTIARGEIIEETDIDWIEIADARGGFFVDDADLIIGKLARRPLAAGAPLRKADLQSPTLIKRGETATIILEAPGLRLTQAGVALANGGAGDLIAFRNINSDREIKAVVAAKGVAKSPFRSATSLASLEE
ncbi:MAG: flagellar basal body P-ring formation chaperone FlgA [Pseudomonadota bacterium]